MRIFVMNTITPPGIDGSIVHRYELVKNLAELGHEVHVVSRKEYSTNLESKKIYIHLEPEYNKKIFKKLVYGIFLLKIIVKYRFDVLYTRSPYQLSSVLAYIAKKIFGLSLVFEINGIAFDENKMKIKNSKNMIEIIKMKLLKYREIFMWRRADALIAVTEGIKRFLVNYGVNRDKVWIVENGANTELFRPMDQSVARNELGLDQECHYVCFVGNLAPWQGVEYLIKAAPLVMKEVPETKFLIVGDGIMKSEWMQLTSDLGLSDKFIFTGTVPYEQVPLYINACDICVAPFIVMRNIQIGLSPLKIYEYLACEKPVVASNIKGVGDLLEKSRGGIPVTPENSHEFAQAIVTLLQNEYCRIQMGRSGRDYVIKNHSWKDVARKVAAMCKQITQKKMIIC